MLDAKTLTMLQNVVTLMKKAHQEGAQYPLWIENFQNMAEDKIEHLRKATPYPLDTNHD